MTGKLVEGTVYVFEFKTFEVELSADEKNPDISDYMYSIDVTNYRVAGRWRTRVGEHNPLLK